MPKTNSRKKIYTLTAVACILFSLLFSIHFWCFNEPFYKSEHDKIRLYGKSIADHIGISDEQLKELTSFTLDYLNDPKASLDLQMEVKGQIREVFTDDEKAHMVDVRRLNLIANGLLIMSGIITFVGIGYSLYRKEMHILKSSYRKALISAMFVITVLGIWILIDFDSFWTMFHHVFFPGNDLWILDLRKDILIMIVPPEFFNHLVIRITLSAVFFLFFFYCLFSLLSRKKGST